MAIQVFHLHGVPAEEADDIRALLESHSIAFYETRPSNWGVSHGAIWVDTEEDAMAARQYIDRYQLDRVSRARQVGQSTSTPDIFRQSPGRFLIVVLGILLVLLLTALPAILLR